MKKLHGKKIVVGVTGSIAAYKSASLVRELKKNGAEVFVIMTPSATNFITPLTLGNLSQNPVSVDMFDMNTQSGGAWHIHRAQECDLMIIAPCSASTIGKIAHGICDNSLVAVATALPRDIPLLIAPVMDSTMFESSANTRNIKILSDDGVIVVPPETGELSSGVFGPGRLPEIDVLMKYIFSSLESKKKDDLKNSSNSFFSDKKILITSGPTREKIDDVRFISNYSSGKMGLALAEESIALGAEVVVVSGPVSINYPENVKQIQIESADEMLDAVLQEFNDADICIMASAVSDFSPARHFDGKLKKDEIGNELTINLKKNKDILSHISSIKNSNQLVVGFALESKNEIEYGRNKLNSKKCDMIVVNSANKPDSGFEGDNNTITIITKDGFEKSYPPMTKNQCAREILDKVSKI